MKIVEGMPAKDYHSHPAMGSTTFRKFCRNPLAYSWEAIDGHRVNETSDALNFGAAYHAMLEGKLDDVVCIPADVLTSSGAKYGKKWTEFAEKYSDSMLLKQDEWDVLMQMQYAIERNTKAKEILQAPGLHEVSVFSEREGIGMKCRLDKLIPHAVGNNIAVDWKTCQDASPQGFMRSAWTYRYDLQQVWYEETFESIDEFLFVAQQKTPPYTVGVYRLSADWIAAAFAEYDEKFNDLVSRLHSGNFEPNFYGGVIELDMPRYAKFQEEYEV